MIKSRLFLVFFIMIIANQLFAQAEPEPAITPVITIDGKDNEWTDAMVSYVEDLDGMMGVANDDSSLILMFRFSDETLVRKVMFGGATLWWQHEGKKKKEFGIKFPMQRQPGARPDRMDRANDRNMDRDMDRKMEMPSFPMELITPVFCISKNDEKLPWSEVNGIAASASMKKGEICFEFRVPLLPGNPYALLPKPGKKLQVCLELGEKVDMAAMRPPGDGGGPGGVMGGGRGGGMGGGMGGPGGGPGGGMGGPGGGPGGASDMKSMFEPEEIWVTVELK